MAATTLREWKRSMMRMCFVLMPLGLLGIVVGALMAWGSQPMLGFLLGSGGMLALVGGALAGKFAIAGPYPAHLPRDDTEVDLD